jgi:hypothetical protein
MRTLLVAASPLAFADSRMMFAPAPVYEPTMNYGQAAASYGPAVAPVYTLDTAEAPTYVQPVDIAYPTEESEGSALFYATGALLVGAAAVVAGRRQEKQVAEPDLEAATGAARVAMLFSSGRSSGSKKKPAARGKKPAPKKKKASRGAAAVDDDDLFVHEGTKGFTGDAAAFVYRQGLAQ